MTPTTTDARFQGLRASLQIAADLIGSDPQSVNPEYIRALSEFGSMNSGIGTEYKEAFEALVVELAQTPRPDKSVEALVNDLEASADLVGTDVAITIANRPDYIQALAEHACLMADISGHHADSVHTVLVGVLSND